MPSAADMQRLADEELMQLAGGGDALAFETVYDRHGGAAFSLAYRITGNRTTAEDAVQEALISVWRNGTRYAPQRGSVRSWILGIVHNRAIDVVRRNLVHQKRRASADGIEETEEAPERTDVEVARRDEAKTVRAAMEELPSEQERVVDLSYFGGFTHVEIAEMLEMPIGTVKGRMRLALEKLRHHLAGELA